MPQVRRMPHTSHRRPLPSVSRLQSGTAERNASVLNTLGCASSGDNHRQRLLPDRL